MSWISQVKAALVALSWAAKFTTTTVDDQLIVMLQAIADYPAVQALIDSLINASLASPEVTTQGLLNNVSPALKAEAEAAVVGKIGDGKLLELLEKVLPLILKFI